MKLWAELVSVFMIPKPRVLGIKMLSNIVKLFLDASREEAKEVYLLHSL
jgi:hypothetical protein